MHQNDFPSNYVFNLVKTNLTMNQISFKDLSHILHSQCMSTSGHLENMTWLWIILNKKNNVLEIVINWGLLEFKNTFLKKSFALWMMSLMFWLHTTLNSSSMSSNSCPYKWDYHHPPRLFFQSNVLLDTHNNCPKGCMIFLQNNIFDFSFNTYVKDFHLKIIHNMCVYCYSCQEWIKACS